MLKNSIQRLFSDASGNQAFTLLHLLLVRQCFLSFFCYVFQLEGVQVTILDDEMEGYSMEEALLDNLLNFAGTPKVPAYLFFTNLYLSHVVYYKNIMSVTKTANLITIELCITSNNKLNKLTLYVTTSLALH